MSEDGYTGTATSQYWRCPKCEWRSSTYPWLNYDADRVERELTEHMAMHEVGK